MLVLLSLTAAICENAGITKNTFLLSDSTTHRSPMMNWWTRAGQLPRGQEESRTSDTATWSPNKFWRRSTATR